MTHPIQPDCILVTSAAFYTMSRPGNEDNASVGDSGKADAFMTDNPMHTVSEGDDHAAKSKGKRKTRIQVEPSLLQSQPLYWKHVGIPGTLLLLLLLTISGLMFYLCFLYSYFFQDLERDMVWIFLVLGILYAILALHRALTWKKKIKKLFEKYTTLLATGVHKNKYSFMDFYRLFSINGEYYLYKLYLFEFVESINQINNMFTIYTCSLEIFPLIIFCLIFAFDGLSRAWFLSRVHSPSRRFKQIMTDVVLDFLCISFPLCLMYFAYNVPIAISEMMLILIWPSICIFSKTRSMFRETLRINVSSQIRRTKTVLKMDDVAINDIVMESIKLQENAFPKMVRRGLAVYNAWYGFCFFVYAMFQVQSLVSTPNCATLHPNDDASGVKILYDSCVVKVPYCGSRFVPSCNCAVLHVEHHNFTALPGMFTQMDGLKKVHVKDGPLGMLPADVGAKLYRLSHLELDFNRLQTLPDSLGQANELTTLFASFNNLTEVPSLLWQSHSINRLDLSTNAFDTIPHDVNMPHLQSFYMSNNSLSSLPPNLFSKTRLMALEVDGNKIRSLPEEVESRESLRLLHIARNKLTDASFPTSMRNLKTLVVLDIRDNELTAVPYVAVASMGTLESLTLSGNPMCNTTKDVGSSIMCVREDNIGVEKCPQTIVSLMALSDGRVVNGCQEQCSKYCLEYVRRWPGKDVCDHGCNSVNCNFDDEDCASS